MKIRADFTIITEKPHNIVNIDSIIPHIKVDLKYRTTDNFTGLPLPGYEQNIAYLTTIAAQGLNLVQKELNKENLSLIIFDSYRPLSSVDYLFNEWRLSQEDIKAKKKFYPSLTKQQIFDNKLIDPLSNHCKGSTIDLGIWDNKQEKELAMGTIFDFLDPKSATQSELITKKEQENRNKLVRLMEKHGFKNYELEWWHFTFIKDPYPETLFDFKIRDF